MFWQQNFALLCIGNWTPVERIDCFGYMGKKGAWLIVYIEDDDYPVWVLANISIEEKQKEKEKLKPQI